jgi:esterase/lipase superfamily enzyme
MLRRQTRPAAFLALAALLAVFAADAAQAQERWPPWQSYGEAEQAARDRQKRAAKVGQAELDALKKQVDQLRQAGKFAEATTAQQRLVKLTEKRYGPNDAQTAVALTTLADLYTAQNKFAEAEPLLKRAITIHEKAKKPDNGEIAQALDNLGSLYMKQGRTADAAPLSKRAADLRASAPATPPAASATGAGTETPSEASGQEAEKKPGAPAPAEAPAAAPPAEAPQAPAEAPTAAPSENTGEAAPPADTTENGSSAAPAEDAIPQNPLGGLKKVESEPAPAAPSAAPVAPAPEAGTSEEGPDLSKESGGGGGLPPGMGAYVLPPKVTTPVPNLPMPTLSPTLQPPVAAAPVPAPTPPPPAAASAPPAPSATPSAPAAAAEEQAAAQAKAQAEAQAASQAQAEDARRAAEEMEARRKVAIEGAAQAKKVQAAPPAPKPPAAVNAAPPPGAAPEAGPDLAKKSGGGGAPAPSAPSAAPPAPPAAASEEQKDWDLVPVFYGTDRAVEPNAQRLMFGSDRGRRLQLGQALVTVPKVHQVPQVERPWALRIPYFDVTIYEQKEDPKQHFTIKEIKALTKEQLLALVKARLKPSLRFKDQALVFVHGYNTSFDNALYRTAQIAYDLEFDGAAFLYSWPSGGGVASYTYDRESAQASEPYLRQFLDMVVKETGAKSVSIIAHSMGNQPLMDVLRDMKSAAPPGVAISQVILAAPDVDADNFTNLAQAIKGFAKGVTLYASANDRALLISRNFWGNYRAGDVPAAGPLVLPGVDSIDVTAASTDAFAINHSGYAENNKLLQDIGKLILNGLRPPDLRLSNLKKVSTDRGDYWRFVK